MRGQAFEQDLAAAALTRPAIEQAKGILMAHRRATPDQAFAELAHASQNYNVKLALLAQGVVQVAAGNADGVDADVLQVVAGQWRWLLSPG
jgi:AmiR/NasT family two-component response regulator